MPGENHRNDEEAPPPPPSEEPQLRFALQFHVGAIALLETLCLLFTISTISSTYYYRWDLTYTVPNRETTSTYYGLYQTCTHSTLYSEHVNHAAKGVCAGVYFAEVFMAFAALFNTLAFVLYLVSNGSTKLPSGEGAWTLLAKAHGACALSLLLGLVAGSAIFHDLRDVFARNLSTPYQEGKLTLTWGFAFNVLALLVHVLAVLVLVSSSPGWGQEQRQEQQVEGQGSNAVAAERISGESASPSAPAKGSSGAGLKEPLLSLEEGGGGKDV